MANIYTLCLHLFLFFVCFGHFTFATVQPRAPNFQYFERPKYRYPYYDETGRGKLLYGYGGPELYQYKTYTPLEEFLRAYCNPDMCEWRNFKEEEPAGNLSVTQLV